MLKKLMKYELKATARTFLPLFAVLILFSVINKLFFLINPNDFTIPQGLSMTVYFITLVGIGVATLLITVQRFYKNLLGDEGYLMFTLPVEPWQLVLSKLLISGFWCIASAVAALISIFVMMLGMNDLKLLAEAIAGAANNMRMALGTSPVPVFIELALLGLLAVASWILVVYLSVALGHQVHKNKLLASFGAFLVVTTIVQAVTSFVLWLLVQGDVFSKVLHHLSNAQIMHLGLCSVIAAELVLGGICFALTEKLLRSRLNLE